MLQKNNHILATPISAFLLTTQGCQIFLDTTYQNGENIPNCHLHNYQIATKLPNVRHIFQMTIEYTKLFPLQCPAKFTQIWIFGLKLKHLATLLGTNPISMM
jgi:hypothetical protein